jgi:large subunit ribosomal protein L22
MAVAKDKVIKISPFKLRRVADVVRGKFLEDALAILSHLPHKGAVPLIKLITGAAANARNNDKLEGQLFVKQIMINEGLKTLRFQPKARGRMDKLTKRYSQAFVEVDVVAR